MCHNWWRGMRTQKLWNSRTFMTESALLRSAILMVMDLLHHSESFRYVLTLLSCGSEIADTYHPLGPMMFKFESDFIIIEMLILIMFHLIFLWWSSKYTCNVNQIVFHMSHVTLKCFCNVCFEYVGHNDIKLKHILLPSVNFISLSFQSSNTEDFGWHRLIKRSAANDWSRERLLKSEWLILREWDRNLAYHNRDSFHKLFFSTTEWFMLRNPGREWKISESFIFDSHETKKREGWPTIYGYVCQSAKYRGCRDVKHLQLFKTNRIV